MQDKLFALDFDGVICDSALETGRSGWQVASQQWPDMPATMPESLLADFRNVRPVMETGFEAILICRLLFEGVSISTLLQDFPWQIEQLSRRDQLDTHALKMQFGAYRDNWIANDLAGWLRMNPLYPGVKEWLNHIPLARRFIITTKQQRFVSAILAANQINIPDTHIFGLERKLKKPQILADLQARYPHTAIVFIEDRLPTLVDVINTESLSAIQLYFAGWGYNTETDKQQAQQHQQINYLLQPASFNL